MPQKITSQILIIDFGSQYTQLIARRVRESGVYSIIKSNNISYDEVKKINPSGIILSGGPQSVTRKTKISLDAKILKTGKNVKNIAFIDEEVVGIQQNNIAAFTFHPELTNDKNYLSWLKYFIEEGKNVRSF